MKYKKRTILKLISETNSKLSSDLWKLNEVILMKLVMIIGSGSVGKMTVGQALMSKTKLRLFLNHMMIEPVIEIFGEFNGNVINQLRKIIFEEFAKSENEGLIFTYLWAFDLPSDWDYILNLVKLFEENGAEIFCVELVASKEIRIQRNRTENRILHKASKRNINLSEKRLLNEEEKYRLVSYDGEVPFKNYIKIDNSELTPDEVAELIKSTFDL